MKLKDGEMLVGFRFSRFATEDTSWPVRAGADGTAVVDAMPLAGPVFYVREDVEGFARGGYAVCRGCRSMSLPGRSDAVRRWAHGHRCEVGRRVDESVFIGTFNKKGQE